MARTCAIWPDTCPSSTITGVASYKVDQRRKDYWVFAHHARLHILGDVTILLSKQRRNDGQKLFYYARDGKLMAVQVRNSESFEVGAAVSLFEFRAGTIWVPSAPYAVTGDGQRFLINAVVEMESNAQLTLVINWATEAKKYYEK
jgi:hypothetical protein